MRMECASETPFMLVVENDMKIIYCVVCKLIRNFYDSEIQIKVINNFSICNDEKLNEINNFNLNITSYIF